MPEDRYTQNPMPQADAVSASETEPVTEAEAETVDEPSPVPVPPLYATAFHTSSEEEMKAFSADYTPSMNLSDFRFCQTQYRKDRRAPSFAELALLNGIVKERKSLADHRVISQVRIAVPAVADTYRDLSKKMVLLQPKRKHSPTLSELSLISGSYMRRIGRDEQTFEENELPFQWLCADGGTIFPNESQTEEPFVLTAGVALVLLTPAEDAEGSYEENISRFLAAPQIRPLYSRSLSVAQFGLLGSFVRHCQGILMDPEFLPLAEEEPFTIPHLISAYRGRTLLATTRENTAWLKEYAPQFGLSCTYFAKSTQTGRIRGPKELRPLLDFSIPFLKGLIDGQESATAFVGEENLRIACEHTSLSLKADDGSSICLGEGEVTARKGLLFAPVLSPAGENCFSAALNTVTDSILRLVCRGIDRRSLGLSLTYSIPRLGMTEEEHGKNLGLILGAYRVAMELALPEEGTRVIYTDGERRVLCTAYAPTPQKKIPTRFVREGSPICYLSFQRTEDGLPRFESLRQMCDCFSELCAKGAILSARAVSGNPIATMRNMAKNGTFAVTEKAEEFSAYFCQGILFELDPSVSPTPFHSFGTILTLPSDALTDAPTITEESHSI